MIKHPKSKTDISPAPMSESEARLRAIFSTAVEAIIIIDDRGCIDTVNPAAEKMFGWTMEELIGRNIQILMPEPFRSNHDNYLANYLTSGRPRIIGVGREALGQRRDGSIFPIDLSVGEFVVGDRRMFTGIVRNITDRHRLQAEVLRIAEMEQRRLGRDLHDDLCQQLAGIEYLCHSLALRLEKAGRDEASIANEITHLLHAATEHTRDLSHGMAPVPLEEGGLSEALVALAIRTEKRFGIRTFVRCPHSVLMLNTEASTHLYRIAQEAVNNAVKHGRPGQIDIGLVQVGERIHLAVRDNGCGLPKGTSHTPGMGLRIMQYRAGMIGGSFIVQNEPDGGTTVACSIQCPGSSSAQSAANSPANPHSKPQHP
jgi:two-component system, LuxR family, sensor kinase FixL